MATTTQDRAPFLSAVVCTLDRADLLGQMLESLSRQTLERSAFEVVVVDDGSKDRTREVVSAFAERLPIRYSYQRNAGLASARNHGVFLARGEVLLFLDDDDMADPGLLEVHAETHRRLPGREVGVLGYTRLDPALTGDPLMHFVTEVGCFLFSYPSLKEGDVVDFTHFWGGRSSCKRSLLIEHGVFNPVFRFGCEDIELGFRLSRHGFKVVYAPRAVSTAVRRIGFDDFCRRLWRQGQSNFVFSRLHGDPVVQDWTEVPQAGERWRKIGSAYDALLRSAREVDRIVRMRLEAGMAIDPGDMALLHRGYWSAFRASKVKGIVEKAAELGHDLLAKARRANGSPPGRVGTAVSSPGVPPRSAAGAPLALAATVSSASQPAEEGTVVSRFSSPALSEFLADVPAIHGGGSITWGLAEDALHFIDAHVERDSRTLETGAGVSTLLFAFKRAAHTCITPFGDEVERLRRYCQERGVSSDGVSFLVAKSQEALPGLDRSGLDLVLIDGGHGFPVPFLDWFFTAPKVKIGGIVVVDDTQLWTGELLRDFLLAEPEWRLEAQFARGAAFRKVGARVEKEWNEQPFVLARSEGPGGGKQ